MRPSARSYVVAIGDRGARPVLEWLAAIAKSGDRVRIVHAYQPMPYTTVDWQLPVDDDAIIYSAVARHTADAARLLNGSAPTCTSRPRSGAARQIGRCSRRPAGRIGWWSDARTTRPAPPCSGI
jgi:hypothetical protein